MSNVLKTKRTGLMGNKHVRRCAAPQRASLTELRRNLRRALSVFCALALVLVPLLNSGWLVAPAASAQTVECSSETLPDRIFQQCRLGPREVERTLEDQALNDLIEVHKLTQADRSRLMADGRNEWRAAVFIRLLDLIHKETPTANEQQALANLAARLKQKRVLAATKALERYYVWKANPCAFVPTTGFASSDAIEYDPGLTCYRNPIGVALYGSPLSPTVEEFQKFGAEEAYQELASDEVGDTAVLTANQVASLGGLGAAGLAGAFGGLVGKLIGRNSVVFEAIFPFLNREYAAQALEAARAPRSDGYIKYDLGDDAATKSAKRAEAARRVSASRGGSNSLPKVPKVRAFSAVKVAGGVFTIVTTAIEIAVTRGIDVVRSSQVEGNLQTALTETRNSTINLSQLVSSAAGFQEVFGAFIMLTMPEADAATEPPPPSPNDRKFIVATRDSTATIDSPTIRYFDWNNNLHTARLNGGWFVDTAHTTVKDDAGNDVPVDVTRLTLSIAYRDWLGNQLMASRSGSKFLLSVGEGFDGAKGLDSNQEVEEIQFLSNENNTLAFQSARIKFDQMTVKGGHVTRGCLFFEANGQFETIGEVAGSGDHPASLAVTVNDGTSATSGGITISDLSVNEQYQVRAKVLSVAPPPLEASFTLKVRNSLGQTSAAPFTFRKTAVVNALPASIEVFAEVGKPYFVRLRPVVNTTCNIPSNFSITKGALPPGLSLRVNDSTLFPVPEIEGTPTASGLYHFTLTETLTNGETQSATYNIFVQGSIAEMPAGAVSWWRGDGSSEDFFDRHNGTRVGAAGYDTGYINEAFTFNGANGYIALPGDTFNPSHDYSFELWFKTAKPGVVLGLQHGSAPYQNVAQGTTAPIYVGADGKLHVRLFGFDGDPYILSPGRVDDNAFHHVAVVYSRRDAVEEVYLDGQLIGTLTAISAAFDPSAFVQLGTGYVSDSRLGMFGWFNFNGQIDEATLYDSLLTANQIRAIYQSGGAGKLMVNAIPMPPSTRDGDDGGIMIFARGGVGALFFSKDDGETYQDFNTFRDLRPGTYKIVVRDLHGRAFRKTVVVENPLPRISVTATTSNGRCHQDGGKITLNATGTTGPPLYSITGSSLNFQTSNVFEGLADGTYTPWVQDPTGVEAVGTPVTLTAPPALGVSPGSVPDLVAGQPFSQTFTSNGGTGARTMTANIVPPWATAQTNTDGSITVSGTPPQAGNFDIFFRLGDANACEGFATIRLTVVDSCPAMSLGPASLPMGKVGQEYPAFAVTPANAPPPFNFTVTGLPEGLTATASGTEVSIGGTPTQSGLFNVQVTATSASNCVRTISYSLNINLAEEPPRPILITEVRTSGPAGPDDEFIELYNNTDSPIDLRGYSVVKKSFGGSCAFNPTFVANFQQPGTIIPARGHFLLTGSAYSLGAYAPSNASLFRGLENDDNIAVFFQAVTPSQFVPERRMDAVGFGNNVGNYCDLMREGNTLPPFAASNSQHSYVRKMTDGRPQDTGDNAADFVLVSTGVSAFNGVQPALGAPGPENLASPINRNAGILVGLIDPAQPPSAPPNRVRDQASNTANNSTFGTLSIRRRFTNNTGADIKRLRFRIANITSSPAPAGTADLRALSSSDVSVMITGGGMTTVRGTTLETPPAQPNGGGFNSTLAAGVVTLTAPLARGASLDVQFLLGVQQTGYFSFYVNIEALSDPPPLAKGKRQTP